MAAHAANKTPPLAEAARLVHKRFDRLSIYSVGRKIPDDTFRPFLLPTLLSVKTF
jgi:hypothetical protein